jgi:hypothetical protein
LLTPLVVQSSDSRWTAAPHRHQIPDQISRPDRPQSLTRTAAQRATHQPMDFTQTICLLGMREQDAVDALGENLT